MFSEVKEFIEKNSVPNDEKRNMIRLNAIFKSKVFIDEDKVEDFNNLYLDYIRNRIASDDQLTEPENHIHALQSLNMLYLDGDWHFNDSVGEEAFEDNCASFAQDYVAFWIEQLKNNGIENLYYFIFVPETFENMKGGFHIFIITDRDVTKDLRQKIQANIKDNQHEFITSMYGDLMEEDITKTWDERFDTGPLYGFQCLLPFAQKFNGATPTRRYRLIETTFEDQTYFLIPRKHVCKTEATNTIMTSRFDIEDEIDGDVFAEGSTNSENSCVADSEYDADEQLCNWDKISKTYGSNVTLILKFWDSLLYLNSNHKFWKVYENHTQRFKYIITPLVKIVILHYLVAKRREFSTDGLEDLILPHLKPFIQKELKSTGNMKDLKQATIKARESISRVINWQHGLFKVAVQAWLDKIEPRKKTDENKSPKIKQNQEEIDKQLEEVSHFFTSAFTSWIKFILHIFCEGLTNEIEPFEKLKDGKFYDPRKNKSFDDVESKDTFEKESFYTETMRIWVFMLLACSYCNTGRLTDAIRSVVTSFMRFFIWTIPISNGDRKIYIYNIHQTKSLTSLPYNQWVLDVCGGNNVRRWIETIYLKYVKPELETINKQRRLIPFVRAFVTAGISINPRFELILQPFDDFARNMKSVCENVLTSFVNEHYDPPRQLDPANSAYFPMRNGILEFKKEGGSVFHTNNHKWFMDGYTNVEWDEHYNYECQEYKEVKRMIEQIYPEEDERNYMLYLYASVLNGSVTKDMFVELYGSGGDGKTTISNAIQSMLGSDGMKLSIEIEEKGRKVFIENPCGLSASMKTEAILTSNTNSHDEGGRVQLLGKRFCSVQEPDAKICSGKLNCSVIKELLSGGTISGRKIFQSAVSFSPNCLITLQTNILMGYSEDNDAVRRRMCVVHHHSKFSTGINEARTKNLRYHFKADPNLNNKITNNPKYWQALFYILLPYANELMCKKGSPISNIVRPDSIVRMTEDSFDKSNGLISWLKPMLEEDEVFMICIKNLVEKIVKAESNVQNRSANLKLVSGKSLHEKQADAYRQLISHFIGSIYRIQEKFYDNDGNVKDVDFETQDGWKRDDLIKAYFQPKAAENMEVSRTIDCSDMYLIGYRFKGRY